MFAPSYFAPAYYAPRYWAPGASEQPAQSRSSGDAVSLRDWLRRYWREAKQREKRLGVTARVRYEWDILPEGEGPEVADLVSVEATRKPPQKVAMPSEAPSGQPFMVLARAPMSAGFERIVGEATNAPGAALSRSVPELRGQIDHGVWDDLEDEEEAIIIALMSR